MEWRQVLAPCGFLVCIDFFLGISHGCLFPQDSLDRRTRGNVHVGDAVDLAFAETSLHLRAAEALRQGLAPLKVQLSAGEALGLGIVLGGIRECEVVRVLALRFLDAVLDGFDVWHRELAHSVAHLDRELVRRVFVDKARRARLWVIAEHQVAAELVACAKGAALKLHFACAAEHDALVRLLLVAVLEEAKLGVADAMQGRLGKRGEHGAHLAR
mmetsp:Transcript_17589/g.50352  ORF Transcript_17589/g.50352 Transcript_17589/m.50352 type:complete len:214 (-) Transcript_17589:439-1080(-)